MPERCLQPLLGPLHQMRGDGRQTVDRSEQTEEERQGLSGEEPSVVRAVVPVRGPEDSETSRSAGVSFVRWGSQKGEPTGEHSRLIRTYFGL